MKSSGQVRPPRGRSAPKLPEYMPGAPTIVRPRPNKNGVIVAHGVSLIGETPAPWVCVVTGLSNASLNDKTGAMLQSWILRADIDPTIALNTGNDDAICGDCVHRKRKYAHDGKTVGTCYVKTFQAPRTVYACFRAGGYREATKQDLKLIRSHKVRLGSYGDPGLVPLRALLALIPKDKRDRTGYTQRWRQRPDLRPYVMASVTTEKDRLEAESLGWRCFYVRPKSELGKPLPRGYGRCPSDKHAVPEHKRVSCYNCGGCHGNPDETKNKGYVIHAHGATESRAGMPSTPVKRSALPILQ